MGDCRLSTPFGRHYRHTRDSWSPKKTYPEVTQWQGKEMSNLERCILGVLAVVPYQPRGAQVIISNVLSDASGHWSTSI